MNSHNHTPSPLPHSHPLSIVTSYHHALQNPSYAPSYPQQLPSFSTSFQPQTPQQPVQHLPNHTHCLPDSLSFAPHLPVHHQISTPANSHFHQPSPPSLPCLPEPSVEQPLPRILTPPRNTTTDYSFLDPLPETSSHPSHPIQTDPTNRRKPPKRKRAATKKRTRSAKAPPATKASVNSPTSATPFRPDLVCTPPPSPFPHHPSLHTRSPAPSDMPTPQGKQPAMTFTVSRPRAPTPHCNFADAVLDASASQSDASLSQFSVYGKALAPRESIASAVADASRRETIASDHPMDPHSGNAAAQQNREVVHQENTLLGEIREIQSLVQGSVDVTPTTNSKISATSRGHFRAAQEPFETQRFETSGGSPDGQDPVESTAEFLATLAQIRGMSQEYGQSVAQGRNIVRTRECQRQDEAERRREDHAARGTANTKSGADLKQSESKNVGSEFGMQNGKPPNNSTNFVSEGDYSTPIPRLPPSHLAETLTTSGLTSSAAMHLLDATQTDFAKATPVGIRDTRNLFTKRPSDTLLDASRNHSLVTNPTHVQHCTPPVQLHQQLVIRDAGSSANPSDSMYPTQPLVRPLFEQQPGVATSSVDSQRLMAPAMSPQPTSYLYTLRPHSNFPYPQYHIPSGGHHPNETQQPISQSSQPATQQTHPSQFQQPSQHLSHPANELLQSPQQLQQPSPQIPGPSAQLSHPPQAPFLPARQPSKPPQQPQTTGTAPQTGRVTKPKKRTAKKSTPRNKSDPPKPTKPKNKRSVNKSANLKRPRVPKKPVPAFSLSKTQAPGGTPCTSSHPSILSLAVPTAAKSSLPALRLHANHGTQKDAFVSPVAVASQNGESMSQQQFHYDSHQPSTHGPGDAIRAPNLRSPCVQQHPVSPLGGIEGRDAVLDSSAVDDASRETQLQNPNQRNSSPKKTHRVLEKAYNAAERAAREGRELQLGRAGTDAPCVSKSASQHRQQVLRLHPPLPQPTLQSATLPNAAPPMLPSLQTLGSAQQSLGVRPPPAVTTYRPILASNTPGNEITTVRQPAEEAGIPTAPVHGAYTPAQSVGQGQSAFSPRTESTQQTLPPDSHSRSPSDTGYPLDADDNVPLAQTRDRMRCSSLAKLSDGQASLEQVGGKPRGQSRAHDMLQQGSARLTLANQSNPVFAGANQPENPVPNNGDTPLKASKRKKAPKSSSPNKRRKKNQPNGPDQESSTNKPHVEANKGVATVMEDGTQNGDTKEPQSNPKAASVPRRVPSSKKSGKGQNKNKAAQLSKSIQKRASPGNKTQRKGKLNQSKTGAASPALEGGSGLRLCLCVRKEDGQQSSEAMTDPNEDSCDSPSAAEKTCSVPKRATKSQPKKGTKPNKQSVKSTDNGVGKEIHVSPCFAEELKNLRTSGILTATERISDPSSVASHDQGIPQVHDIPCALCQQEGSSNDMVKHPCFPLRVFDICKTCSETVSRRVEENGAKRKEAEVTSEKAITEQTTLFVMLIEEMVRHFTPSDREQRDVNRVYEFISSRNWSEMVERGESLSVNFDMLTVMRVLLRKVGFSLRGGKLRWPGGQFTLPSIADTRALVSNSIPARIEDLKRGILPGEAAWDKTFLEDEKFSSQRSSCAIYEKIFSLLGVKLVHANECCVQSNSESYCDVKFDAVSMGTLMYRTAAMLSGTVTQELLAECWTKEEALRIINEMEIGRLNGSFDGATQSCCICGGSGKYIEGSATLRFSNCAECLKSFCSICLLNVLGTSEYLRSFEQDGYCCMLCRLHKNAELNPGSKWNQGKKDQRLRLRENSGIKKGAERRVKSLSPLLLLSRKVRADVLLRSELHSSRESLGFAMFCEVVNENSARCGINPHSDPNPHEMCLECKLPVDDKKLGGEKNSLRCGQNNCPNVMHRTCMAPQRNQIRRRGSRSKWCCPHHQCSKCEQHDESKLLRCRTCPATFCKDHMPLPREVYVFSEKSFACFKCRSSLRIPQPLRLKLPGSKSERKRNAIAQALAIDQRKRSSVVKKLSEGPGPKFFGASALNELRIRT